MFTETLTIFNRFRDECGDPVAASNLTLAHVMLQYQQAQHPLTVAETAKRLKVSEKTVRRLCKAGELVYTWVGRQIRILPESIDSYLKQGD